MEFGVPSLLRWKSMLAIVHGELLEQGSDHVLVDVGGLGYKVHVPSRSLVRLGPPGTRVRLRTHLEVREDKWTLYGFETPDEVRLFELLIGVSGIGPRTAMAALDSCEPRELVAAVASGDEKRLTAIDGVGKKTAARMVLELKEKLRDFVGTSLPAGPAPSGAPPVRSARDDARAALANLGFEARELEPALDVAAAEVGADAGAPSLLKAALARLRRR